MNDRHLLYIVGQPGAGKSTILRAALEGVPSLAVDSQPPLTIYPGGCEIGRRRDGFSGTDALAMNIQPVVADWLIEAGYSYAVAEGDRLGNDKFFNQVLRAGWLLSVCYINTPDDLAASRRSERAARLGNTLQNRTWVAGRISKAARLAKEWHAWYLDGSAPLNDLAAALREHAVIRGLRGELYQAMLHAA